MHTLCYMDSMVGAEMAAMFLRRHGVPATVSGSPDFIGPIGRREGPTAVYALVLMTVRDRARAQRLMEEYRAHPPQFEPGWERQAEPDLSRLDPALVPPCPSCGGRLEATREVCPSCGGRVDVAALVVGRHGPEAIEACCVPADEGEAPEIPDEMVDEAPLDCSSCGRGLDGLARVGACPSCGARYDKRAMLRRFFGEGGV